MGLQKIAFNYMVERGGKLAKSLLCSKPQKAVANPVKYLPLSKDTAAFSQTVLPKASDLLDLAEVRQFLNKSPKFIQDNFFDCDVVCNIRYYKDKNLIRMTSGFKYDDIDKLQLDKKICCYLDNNNRVTQAIMLDESTKRIQVADFVTGLKQSYSKPEVEALHYYKYHPDSIHAKLRYGRDIYSGDWQTEVSDTIKKLETIFSNKSKVSANSERRTIYRALQDVLSDDEITNLSKIGGVFSDKSFCSATSDLAVAKRFAGRNPVLEIDFPKDAKYIDMDKLFNIDRQHWNESEILLDKNARFQVTGFDKENNIIKVKYLSG